MSLSQPSEQVTKSREEKDLLVFSSSYFLGSQVKWERVALRHLVSGVGSGLKCPYMDFWKLVWIGSCWCDKVGAPFGHLFSREQAWGFWVCKVHMTHYVTYRGLLTLVKIVLLLGGDVTAKGKFSEYFWGLTTPYSTEIRESIWVKFILVLKVFFPSHFTC